LFELGERGLLKVKAVLAIVCVLVGAIAVKIQLDRSTPSETVKIGVISDIHYSDEFAKNETTTISFYSVNITRQAIQEWKDWGADFAIQLGDYSSDQHSNGSWRSVKDCLRLQQDFFDNVWVSKSIPLYNVLGNHEIGVASKSDVLALWTLPKKPPVAYYSFDVRDFHFVVLDNHNYESANCTGADITQYYFRIWREQKKWLIQDLANTSKPTILFIHVPLSGKFYPKTLYRVGKPYYNRIANCIAIWPILEADGDVIAVFEGHYHNPASGTDEPYHWTPTELNLTGNTHFFGVPCPIKRASKGTRGFLTLNSENCSLTWEVRSENFTRYYEFSWGE